MIKIALCDDDISDLNLIHELLDQYRREQKIEIHTTTFQSPLDLLTEIERGTRFDILLLDILMPGLNGIDTAAEIRSHNEDVKIIFLTSSSEFAVQSYSVHAYFYQLKPIMKEHFFHLMDSVLAVCSSEQNSSLILRCKSGITRITPRQLEYCEVIHRTLMIHLTSGKVLESIGSLDDLSRQLTPYGNFLRPHRSYLVNLEHVQHLSYRAITMACLVEIPIPRGKYNDIKTAFMDYAFQNRMLSV